jgi:hypothetical protein
MELPHFLIAAGFIFLVGGFAGFALQKKMQIKPLTRTHLRPARLIRRRKASHREFDLAVGKLAPVFDNSHVTTCRIFVENLARLEARGNVKVSRK